MEEFTVSKLSAYIKRTIDQNFSKVLLRGEVSALKVHSSGHIYFCLKDEGAIIRAICWKSVAQKHTIKLVEGMDVKCIGQVTTYPMQSQYQFVVEHFETAGIGELLKILEERKKRLAAEGLFDANRKKPIPKIPRLIGVITSPTGAVIQDMLHRIRERFPREILLWPVAVQGVYAADQVVTAVTSMNNLPAEQKPDLLIVARGGGSLEDLMPFNEESVVRAVAASDIPVISAIGHETDTTLIDYAADLRAPTPTAAAEFAVPERTKLHGEITRLYSCLSLSFFKQLEKKRLVLQVHKILTPQNILEQKVQQVDFASERCSASVSNLLAKLKLTLAKITITPPTLPTNTDEIFQKIKFQIYRYVDNLNGRLSVVSTNLEANSYNKILQRGFALVTDGTDTPVTTASEANKARSLHLSFSDGKVTVYTKIQQELRFE